MAASANAEAAVGGNDLPGDVARCRAGEEQYCLGDLNRIGDASHRNATWTDHGPAYVVACADLLAAFARHAARKDGIHANPVYSKLAGKRSCETVDTGLGCVIVNVHAPERRVQ